MSTKTILTRAVVFRFKSLDYVRLLSVLQQGSKSTSEAAIFNNMVLFVYTKAGSLNVDNVWVSKN